LFIEADRSSVQQLKQELKIEEIDVDKLIVEERNKELIQAEQQLRDLVREHWTHFPSYICAHKLFII